MRAGDAAREAYASHSAIAQYEQGLRLLGERPELAPPELAARLREALDAARRSAELATPLAASKHLARARLLQAHSWLEAGNFDEAESALQRGLRLADQTNNPPLRWQGRTLLGALRERQRRRASAAAAYASALTLLEAVAATLRDAQLRDSLSRSADAERMRAGLAAAEARRPSHGHDYPAGLSEREVEVLRLVVAGRSNAAIAEELVVSVKTVNSHVASILSKTGAPNRAAAAAFALHAGLASAAGAIGGYR